MDAKQIVLNSVEKTGYRIFSDSKRMNFIKYSDTDRFYFANIKLAKINEKEVVSFDLIYKKLNGSTWERKYSTLVKTSINSLDSKINQLVFETFGSISEKFLDSKELELTKIAQKHLSIPTLQTRNSDSLDFHDVSVWGVQAALKAAYEKGFADGNKAK